MVDGGLRGRDSRIGNRDDDRRVFIISHVALRSSDSDDSLSPRSEVLARRDLLYNLIRHAQDMRDGALSANACVYKDRSSLLCRRCSLGGLDFPLPRLALGGFTKCTSPAVGRPVPPASNSVISRAQSDKRPGTVR